MHAEHEIHFRDSAAKALLDPQLRANFRRAMDGLIAKRKAQFPDPRDLQDLRDLSTAIRSRSLLCLPELLEQLEASCQKNGIKVHWAETCEQANQLILGLLQAKGAKTLVKGKSMVSEEMHLNAFLESKGIEALESDLGEYIIQLDGETPSHIIMPAIHKNKDQIARQFSQKIKDAKYTEDVDELTAMARKVLRQKFLDADVGLNGANFLEDLRSRIGDDAFFAFLKDYASRESGRIATSADFFSVLREHTDKKFSDIVRSYMRGDY